VNIVDWILIGLLCLGAVSGWRNGFVGSLVRACGSIIGLIIAYQYYDDLAIFLDDRFGLKEPLSTFLQAHLTLPPLLSQFQLQDILGVNFSAYLETILPQSPFQGELLTSFENFLKGLQSSLQISLGEIIHQYLASALLSIAAFFIIWFVVGSGLQIIAQLFRGLIDKTILGQVDSLAGLLVGTLLSAVVLSVLLGLLSPVLNLANIAESLPLAPIAGVLAEAKLVPWFNSLFNTLFAKFTIGTFV
jgi:uncharacterized membrane protein required for colicin V production